MKSRWGFLGCGNLSQAMITGLLRTKALSSGQIFATNRTKSKLDKFVRQTGIRKAATNIDLVKKCDIIVLGAKPQDLMAILDEIHPYARGKIFLSLAAGHSSKAISKRLVGARSVGRVMTNLPIRLGKGVLGVYFESRVRSSESNIIKTLKSLGFVVTLKSEKLVDVVLAASSSGVGFLFWFMEIYFQWLCSQGLSKLEAQQTIQKVFLGAALLAEDSGSSFERLLSQVTSKKGTTLAGLKSMRERRLDSALKAGLDGARNRSRELSRALR
ncbi:MAG: pyrroline-5-carboxylate reductase [Oligoflexia bacterium]|nr:pyrroline-5-carboxylate reductase [Oligoflexia bacterium]